MKNKIGISFRLFGSSVSPKEITRLTAILPTTALLEGERNAELNLPRKNLWTIESTIDSEVFEDHWESLKYLLIKSQEVLREISATGSATLSIVIDSSYRLPSITIPPSMSAFASYVNAAIDIDHLQS